MGMDDDLIIKAEKVSKRFTLQNSKLSFWDYIKSSFVKKRAIEENENWVLQNISFEIKRGTSLGIMGKNGAGKSTLLRILAGITYPTDGKVIINGNVGSLLEIGSGFHPELTGKENIYYNAKIMGIDKTEVEAAFDSIIDFSELSREYINTPVKYYSSGMFLRLAFSSVIHQDKDVLLLDEIMSVGDKDFKKKCLDKMYSFKESGKSIVLVSHSMSELIDFCDTSVFLKNGLMQHIGKTSEVVNSYNKVYFPLSLEEGNEETDEHKEQEEPIGNVAVIQVEEERFSYIEVNKIQFNNASNSNKFSRRSEISILVDFELKEDIEEFNLSFSLRDIKGNALFGESSDSQDFILNEKGSYSLKWRIQPFLLNTGIYQLGLAELHKGTFLKTSTIIGDFEVYDFGLDTINDQFQLPIRLEPTMECKRLK